MTREIHVYTDWECLAGTGSSLNIYDNVNSLNLKLARDAASNFWMSDDNARLEIGGIVEVIRN